MHFKKLFCISLVLATSFVYSQTMKEKALNIMVGYGITAPYDSVDDIADDGFYLQGELVLTIASWVEFKPYLGFITTSSNGKDLNNNPTNEKAETKALLFGGKTRLRAPIPWVAPYAEIGIGASVGKFVTETAFYNYNKSGILYHIPFAFGLELGKQHQIDLGLTYYFTPSVKQFSGAFAVGITIPLKH
ncbi:hypothetical protein PK35_06440 [Tamlana nanhaiensis]|uniref:Outer membrane protein beta-barrel domain-containing protein n=2 Tax=Neotamlana nanhaiensis TaxID=1382798 RepID=A0A0D7W2Y3_9FLAO|nr:hypothetical protein PK35_06440 [Tamlana nanhaiensis]